MPIRSVLSDALSKKSVRLMALFLTIAETCSFSAPDNGSRGSFKLSAILLLESSSKILEKANSGPVDRIRPVIGTISRNHSMKPGIEPVQL